MNDLTCSVRSLWAGSGEERLPRRRAQGLLAILAITLIAPNCVYGNENAGSLTLGLSQESPDVMNTK